MGRNINNIRYAVDTILTAESEEELKSHLMRVKEKSEKSWFKIEHRSEKAMATHSTVLAWRIPGTGEPGGLLPMGSQRVGHN